MRWVPPDRPVVYTTGIGRICPRCQKPVGACGCRQGSVQGERAAGRPDGIVRIFRDRRNRQGKTVTVVTGIPGDGTTLEELAGALKRLCGSGGTVKDGVIEIQGEHRDLVAARLAEMGYRVKLAGG